MILKSLFIFLLVFSAFSYQKEENVLVLKDGDFPQVIDEHEYIFIKFYASWCSHCEALAPVYKELANDFKANNSKSFSFFKLVMFGKVECSENQNVSNQYEIQGYPKLIIFHKGERIEYEGQRNKHHLANWLNKILTDPLKPINQQEYDQLEESDIPSIVFHSSPQSPEAEIVRKIAYTDEINSYYIAQLGKKQNLIEMFRPVHPTISNEYVLKHLKLWIRQNQRPLVRPFTDEVIDKIFMQNITGLFLFNEKESVSLYQAFKQTAKQYLKQEKEIIFSNVEKSGEHFDRLGKNFLKIDPSKIAVVLVDRKQASKFVLIKDPQTLTFSDITKFLEDWESKKVRRYDIPDAIDENEEDTAKETQNSEETPQESEEPHQQENENEEL